MTDTTPYDELDPAIRNLCRALNEFPALRTCGSCQGFIDEHEPGQPWEVALEIDSQRAAVGLRSMQALVWVCEDAFASATGWFVEVTLRTNAPLLPRLNDRPLYFVIEAAEGHPDELAEALSDVFLPMLRRVWERQRG